MSFQRVFSDIAKSKKVNFEVNVIQRGAYIGDYDMTEKKMSKSEFTQLIAKNRETVNSYERVANICYFTMLDKGQVYYYDYEI